MIISSRRVPNTKDNKKKNIEVRNSPPKKKLSSTTSTSKIIKRIKNKKNCVLNTEKSWKKEWNPLSKGESLVLFPAHSPCLRASRIMTDDTTMTRAQVLSKPNI